VFERRLYYHIDWAMIAALAALCAIGLANIYSATGGPTRVYYTQIYGIILGCIAFVVALSIDYRSLCDKSHFIYFAVVGLLLYVLFFGVVRGGSRRWIDLGVFNLQPSEFAKATLALVLAKFFGESRRGALTQADLAIAGVITAVPLLIIMRQPDLGTAVTLVPIVFAIAFVAGMPMRIIGIIALIGVLAAPLAWKFARRGASKPSSTRRKTRRARGISKFRPASRWVPAGSSAKGSRRGRKASCASFRLRTTTSFSRSRPRNTASRASSWRSPCICS
jgi:rod shape determining protein RodA